MSALRHLHVAALLLLLHPSPARAQVPCADPTTGTGNATWYLYAAGGGACTFTDDADPMVAAVDPTVFAGSAMCGRWIRVTGPLGSVDARVVDLCPECLPGDVDLNRPAFEAIADPAEGRVPVSWETIPAPDPGDVSYAIDPGSNPWFLQVQVRDHRYGVVSLEYDAPGLGWVVAPRQSYNWFRIDATLGVPTPLEDPFAVRVTDVHGQSLVQAGIPLAAGSVFVGDGQFPPCQEPTSAAMAAAPRIHLRAPHPNPFNPSTTLVFELDQAGPVRLEILDLGGRRVCTIVDGPRDAGVHRVRWQGRDDGGRRVASGVYLCRIRSGSQSEVRRLALLK